MSNLYTPQMGWLCPACGRGVSPTVDVCPCNGRRLGVLPVAPSSPFMVIYNDWLHRFDFTIDTLCCPVGGITVNSAGDNGYLDLSETVNADSAADDWSYE